ncbi:hypothetical protein [Pseudomonas sp. S1_E04]
MKEPAPGDLRDRCYPVREDMALQHKVWRFERVGWYALLLLIGLTVAGLFSKGPLSTAETRSADGSLRVEYQRFLRNGASDVLVIHIAGRAREVLEVQIKGEWLRGFEVEMLQPPPIKASAAGEGVTFWVLGDNHGQAVLHLALRSDGVGRFDTQVALPQHSASVRLSQFIYP